jgi:Ala-tRNA(Pro) deacylase
MEGIMQIQDYLSEQGVPFQPFMHRPSIGALRLATALDVSSKTIAKSVLIEADGELVLAVLPADRRIDLEELAALLEADRIKLADEQRCQELFPDCELGVLPPLGSLVGVRTVMDRTLADMDEMTFEGNRHDEAIRVATGDYELLENPLIGDFSREPGFG